MADRDGIREHFPGPWKNCVKYSSSSPTIMAQALHSVFTNTATRSSRAGLKAIEPLSSQLLKILNGENAQSLSLPNELLGNRACQVALRAAQQIIIENTFDKPPDFYFTKEQIQKRLLTKYAVELCDTQFLAIFEVVGIPAHFTSPNDAREFREEVKTILGEVVEPTANELAQNLENPMLTQIKMPRKEKRSEQEILQDKVLINLEAL
jgi:hypothetical protein